MYQVFASGDVYTLTALLHDDYRAPRLLRYLSTATIRPVWRPPAHLLRVVAPARSFALMRPLFVERWAPICREERP